ncbi:hypothetical protein F4777DRAFT_521250 [Nemania sp. FL0916]|nr:hypothetical protein F4777DRAFT_521250 [Nemania sp. FL0916]
MFGGQRRRRPPTAPLQAAPSNPSAATAAASAFMSASASNPNRALSSAAAAAALRARPHTPTRVADVQTKRTVRRSASASSSRSPAGARTSDIPGRLERRGSSSSMTERTFRSLSPHRPSAAAAHDARPPVPQIPDSHRAPVTNATGATNATPAAAGVGMQTFRTASQKMADDQSSWHVRPTGDTANVRTTDALMRTAKPPPPGLPSIVPPQPTRSDSRNSINFSYPTAFRPQSPPASPTSPSLPYARAPSPHRSATGRNAASSVSSKPPAQNSPQLVYDPNSRRMVPKAQVEDAVEYHIKQVAEKPPRRKRDGAVRREGNQLAKGTVARTKGSVVDEAEDLRKPPEREQPVETVVISEQMPLEEGLEERSTIRTKPLDSKTPDKPIEPATKPEESATQGHPPSKPTDSSERESDLRPNHPAQEPQVVVRHEPTSESSGPAIDTRPLPSQAVLDALDAVPTRQVYPNSPQPQPSAKEVGEQSSTTQDHRPPATTEKLGLEDTGGEQEPSALEDKPAPAFVEKNGSLRRPNSNSPARQARFAPRPAENLAVRHAPLPRSASPIKSAMKHSSPAPRETSPLDHVSNLSVSSPAPSDQKEEPSPSSRKKAARVSFDDHGTVIVEDTPPVAEAESPASQSPQGSKRTWFSNIGRSKKKEIALEDDEIMKPRPALPSFGSIRDKKTRESGERPLVRPLEPTYSPAIPSSPESRPQSSSTVNESEAADEVSLGQSSDQAIGALLLQDQTSRNVANISRFREPLPPVVTSIEGSGYSSDSSQDSDLEKHHDTATEAGISTMDSSTLSTQLTQPDTDEVLHDQSTARKSLPETSQTEAVQRSDIPEISVIHPSPMPQEHSPDPDGGSTTHYFELPGVFPSHGPDSGRDRHPKSASEGHRASSSTEIFEPPATHTELGQAGEVLPSITRDTTIPVAAIDDSTGDESDESIYSDAYEDIPDPDLDSGGFMSLDAIVENSTHEEEASPTLQQLASLPPAVITSALKRTDLSGDLLANQTLPAPPKDANDWEQAKAFWRSLTAEKRRQLELEAAEEAAAEGDREEVSQPIRRNSTKRRSPEPIQPAVQKPVPQSVVAQPASRMRTSLRSGQSVKTDVTASKTGMRKTLRANGGLESVAKPTTQQVDSTRTVATTPSASSRRQTTKLQSRSSTMSSTVPASKVRPAADATPALQRRGSDASDSSFKRSRRPTGGAFAFRKTMRQDASTQPHRESVRGAGRFSLRSLSPAGSSIRHEPNTGFATSSSVGMRRTLRSNSESSQEGKRSSIHFPLFARSSKTSPKASKWASRFENSSDEDDKKIPDFRSRIHDSSDEDETRPRSSREPKPIGKGALNHSGTTPNLPKPATAPEPEPEDDSPELSDSDDDEMPSPLRTPKSSVTNGDFASRMGAGRQSSGAIGTSTLGGSRSGRGGLAPSFTSPATPAKEGRGSLFSMLRRNKKADQTGKIQRSDAVDSAARRDTKLERNPRQLKDLRGEPLTSPKLQKHALIGRSDSGGLPRPTSAGTTTTVGRSATTGAVEWTHASNRRTFSAGVVPQIGSFEMENASVDSPSVLKKKKFGALRRMFKLDE